MENLRIHTLLNLRKTVFDNVMDLHVGYFNSQRKGDIIAKIASDVQVVQFSVTATLQVVLKEPLTLIAYMVVLFLISAQLSLFVFLVVPVDWKSVVSGKVVSFRVDIGDRRLIKKK